MSEIESDEEIESRWEALFAESSDVIERMADQALEEHRCGRTLPLDPDTL
jgi:hypothetical protein